jgi:hypothetical protein
MDALLLTIYAQTIAVNNTKVGLFGDQRYIVLGFLSAALYLLFHYLGYRGASKVSLYGKFTVLFILILTTVLGVGYSYFWLRDHSGTNAGISDAGLATELSGKMLVLGQNPYTADYFKTDLVNIPYQDAENNTVNPALYYYVYPPMVPVLAGVSYKLISPRLHWFDVRVVYIAFLLILLALGYFKWGMSETYFLYLIGVGLNPDFIRTLMEGANDVQAIAFFMAAVLILEKKKYWILAAVLYAFAIGSKQIIWSSVPFVAVALWKEYGFKYMSRFMAITGAICLIIFGPFLIWDSKMFIAGLIGFHAGTVPHSYPIHNFGFGKLLVQLGIVKNIYAYYNFMVWQFGGLSLLGLVMYKIHKHVNMPMFMMMGWTAGMMILFIFNRAMNFSYLGIMQVAVVMTVCFGFPQISGNIKQIKSFKKK